MDTYSKTQTFWLVALRMFIGWHFLYEGIVKLLNPKWTAYGYLMESGGWFSSFFQSMAGNPDAMNVINFLNVWGLILVGLGLIVGCLSRIACIGGIMLLLLYYLSHPPYLGTEYMMPAEGSYLWIDKNMIEIAALALLYVFPTSKIFGLDNYILRKKKNPQTINSEYHV